MMKSVLFIVLALAVAVTAQQTFPNAACTAAPGSSAANVDLAAPTFVAAGSSLSSTHLILNFDVDARYRSINFQFTTGSQGSLGLGTNCDFYRDATTDTQSGTPAPWTSAYPTAGTTCTDKIRITSDFTAPQTALGQCFAYDNTTDPNFVFYTAVIKITTEQNRAQIRNTPIVRTVTTAVQLRFRFQRFITVNSSSLTVVGNANILSDVISQVFDTATEHTTIVLLTSVQQPYQLTLNGAEATTVSNGYTFISSITETHSGNVGAANAPAVPQACTAGGVNNLGTITTEGSSTPTACTQKWSVTVAAPANTCLFNAVINYGFVLNVTSDYVGSFAGITSLQGGNVYNPSYTLATNDYCAKIVDDITLSGTLTPYGTDPINPTNPGTPLFNYLFGQTVYFLAFVQASAGPSITGTNFDQATVTTVSTTVQKVVDFTTATQNGFLGFGKWNYVQQGAPQYAGFKFLIDENTVTLENFDVAQPVTVSATFRVDYQNLGNAGSSAVELASAPKFRSFAAGNQGLAMTVDVGVTRPATATGSSSLVAMVAGIAAGCVALTAFVALFLYRRSTSKFAEQVSAPVDPKELEAIENRLATTAV